MSISIGSRDLSDLFLGRLEVTIVEVGTRDEKSQTAVVTFNESSSLSKYVWRADVDINTRSTPVKNPTCAPWAIVDFDLEARKISVKLVIDD